MHSLLFQNELKLSLKLSYVNSLAVSVITVTLTNVLLLFGH